MAQITQDMFKPISGIIMSYDNIGKALVNYFDEVFEVKVKSILFGIDDDGDFEVIVYHDKEDTLTHELVHQYSADTDYPGMGQILIQGQNAVDLVLGATQFYPKGFFYEVYHSEKELHIWWEVKE